VPGALTVVSLLANYYRGAWPCDAPAEGRAPALRGRVARYAWGRDYHGRLKRRLNRLGRTLEALRPGAQWRAYVDSGPVLERGWAERAGLGWIGKNGNLIRQGAGSWYFLGEIVCDVSLPAGEPARNRCGRCARCIPACPTGAIVAPYQVEGELAGTIGVLGPTRRGDTVELRQRRALSIVVRRDAQHVDFGPARPIVAVARRGFGQSNGGVTGVFGDPVGYQQDDDLVPWVTGLPTRRLRLLFPCLAL